MNPVPINLGKKLPWICGGLLFGFLAHAALRPANSMTERAGAAAFAAIVLVCFVYASRKGRI
jgi:hypothetical protein